MDTVILVIHVLSALALVAMILVQRSEGGALSGLGGGNPSAGIMSARGTASALTRITAILATIFMVSALLLASAITHNDNAKTIMEQVEEPKADDVPLAQ